MTHLVVMTENYRQGGGNRWLVDVANSLAPSFDELSVVSNPGGLHERDLARLRYPHNRLDIDVWTVAGMRERGVPRALRAAGRAAEPLLFGRTVRAARDQLARLSPDLLVTCAGGYPAARGPLAWVVAAGAAGVPNAISIVGTPTPRPRGLLGAFEQRWERRMDTAVWRSTSLVVANTQPILGILHSERDMPASLGCVVHNGIENAAVPTRGPAGSTLMVGVVTRIEVEKGIFVLLDALDALIRRYPMVRATIAGMGPDLETLRTEIARRGLTDTVLAPGFLPGDVDDALSRFDVYAMPSFQEGLPYAMLEAMRAARPIVITNVGGVPEVLTDDEDALLVSPRSASALEVAIERLIVDASLRERLGAAARKRFEDGYTVEKMTAGLRAAFAERGLLPATV